MNDFFLIPTVCVQYKDGKYFLKNALYNYEKLQIENLNKIVPEQRLIKLKIFAPYSEMETIKNEMFSVLENKYKNSEVALGYIETTSKCPYKCKMCPKGTNKLERNMDTMPIWLFLSVINALNNQKDITLHLFGDPLYDESIYEKIRYANSKNIEPSFSTNLISLQNIKINELRKVKLRYLTISLDSIFPEELSQIRGNLTEEQMKKGWRILDKIIGELENNRFIEKICLQSINFKNNEYTREQLREYAEQKDVLEFYEKSYIEFPNTDKIESALSTVYKKDEWMWLYHILHKSTPYRCMKPWNRKETAILSDGRFVPCCMCYNDKNNFGSVLEKELAHIQNGEKFYSFRKRIWSGTECGEICNSCSLNQNKISHSEIPTEDIEYLREFCIDSW